MPFAGVCQPQFVALQLSSIRAQTKRIISRTANAADSVYGKVMRRGRNVYQKHEENINFR